MINQPRFYLKPDVEIAGRKYLSTEALAEQTGFAKKTLEIHRSKKIGCRYLKIAGRALYDVEDAGPWLESLYVETAV
jgi:hypothetical protein